MTDSSNLPDPEETAQAAAWTEPVAVPTGSAVLGSLAAMFGQGRAVAKETGRLAAEFTRIARGSSAVAPAKGDWRFADPAWTENPLYRRLGQVYLAWSESLDHLVEEMDPAQRSTQQAQFAVNVLTSAAAPTNTLLGNPAAVKKTYETGGRNLLRGSRNWVRDVRTNRGMPATVDRDALQVGRDLALTSGAVVDRDAVAELLQYSPTTSKVRQRPVLFVPPPIGRYYFLDLRPGRSFVEYAVGRGLQTFVLSWRNPTPEQGSWDLDTYAARVIAAIDTARAITGSPDINVIGFCAGGIITTTALNYLAAASDDRVHSASFAVTLLDFKRPAPIQAFGAPRLLAFASARSRRKGVISAQEMGAAFTWMRPNDLVWNYWANNYLLGQDPPVFDILAWNADGTNLPATLHEQFLQIFERNGLTLAGLDVLGMPIQLSQIKLPIYVTGAMTDHLTPWKGCYETTQLFSGPATFVLSNSGHIQSLVNPPGNPKAKYFAGGEPGPDPDQWLSSASQHAGSWWEHWTDWLLERSGEDVEAPQRLGTERYPARDPAPGLYVRDLQPPT